MSTTAAPSTLVPQQRESPYDPEERGTTIIRDGVLTKIAAEAASEVEGARGRSSRLGGWFGEGDRSIQAQVRRSGRIVTLHLEIALDYPRPIRRTAGEVRARVRDQVEGLTGLAVRHVDIDIVELVRQGRTE